MWKNVKIVKLSKIFTINSIILYDSWNWNNLKFFTEKKVLKWPVSENNENLHILSKANEENDIKKDFGAAEMDVDLKLLRS